MAALQIKAPYEYYPDPTIGRPVFNGQIFIGVADTDPTIVANQILALGVFESGDEIGLQQPISTNRGGIAVDPNGDLINIATDGVETFAISVLNKQGSLVYYNGFATAYGVQNLDTILSLTLAEAIAKTDAVDGVTVVHIKERDWKFKYESSGVVDGAGVISTDTSLNLNIIVTGEVTLKAFGATASSSDNIVNILAALHHPNSSKIIHSEIAEYKSSKISPTQQASNKSLTGSGYGSSIALIGNLTATGEALLHIGDVGDNYGGTYKGPSNFYVDLIRFRGDLAVTTTSSISGIAAVNPTGFSFGTIWTHGNSKSGMIISGAVDSLSGSELFTWDNGNNPSVLTGGQGIAIASDTDTHFAVNIEYIEAYDNGLNNFGIGIDSVRGKAKIGTLNTYDNGISAGKIVNTSHIKIGSVISSNNNKHTGQTFGSFYTNGDFGLLEIGSLTIIDPIGSGLVMVNSGEIIVSESLQVNSGTGSGVSAILPAGKSGKLTINNLSAIDCSIYGCVSGGDLSISLQGKTYTENCTTQGIQTSAKHISIDELHGYDNLGATLFIPSTQAGGSARVGWFMSTGISYAASAAIIGAGCTDVSFAGRSFGHSQTLSDSGTGTYKADLV